MSRKKQHQNNGLTREIHKRIEKDTFLIVCEGERTEPYYFDQFAVSSVDLKVVGTGFNTGALVKETIRLMQQAKDPYDQVWCVFDRDSFPLDYFNSALRLADQRGIRVAYSNEAFELWYLLHFHYYDSAITREQYKEKLSYLLGKRYEKNDESIFDLLWPKQEQAIKHASSLLKSYSTGKPASSNPSTTVHLLVEELRKFMT